MRYSNEWLLEALAKNQHFEYIYFWGHTPKVAERIGKECLSQWYHMGFEHKGTHYPTAEHWMMVHKALAFDDWQNAKSILTSPNPQRAKKLGRQVNNYDNQAWAKVKYDIVVQGNCYKFGQHEALRDYLLGTKNAVLVEASPYDNQWGIGMDAAEAANTHPRDWRGTNYLGWALMEVRDALRESESDTR